jgi:hypothetical protein
MIRWLQPQDTELTNITIYQHIVLALLLMRRILHHGRIRG